VVDDKSFVVRHPVHAAASLDGQEISVYDDNGAHYIEMLMVDVIEPVPSPTATQTGPAYVGSLGSTTEVSRSQPSFSSLMCWIATALALASRSGSAWNSETQARYTL
jgi:hypothetical protein